MIENNLAIVIGQLIQENKQYFQRGMELAKHPLQSPEVNEVYAAFAQAQGDFTAITKDTKGYNYTYADLATILDSVRPVLSKYGLHLSQYSSAGRKLHTRIGHKSGQFFESQFEVPYPTENSQSKMNFMQEIGSRRTYARRYEVLSILGLAPKGEDDDAAGYRK